MKAELCDQGLQGSERRAARMLKLACKHKSTFGAET